MKAEVSAVAVQAEVSAAVVQAEVSAAVVMAAAVNIYFLATQSGPILILRSASIETNEGSISTCLG